MQNEQFVNQLAPEPSSYFVNDDDWTVFREREYIICRLFRTYLSVSLHRLYPFLTPKTSKEDIDLQHKPQGHAYLS